MKHVFLIFLSLVVMAAIVAELQKRGTKATALFFFFAYAVFFWLYLDYIWKS